MILRKYLLQLSNYKTEISDVKVNWKVKDRKRWYNLTVISNTYLSMKFDESTLHFWWELSEVCDEWTEENQRTTTDLKKTTCKDWVLYN